MHRFAPLALLLALAACQDPNNQVIGGVASSPPAVIRAVRSSIHYPIDAVNEDDTTQPVNAIVMSELENLCDRLAADPDLLRSQTKPFVAWVMLTPPKKLGAFYIRPGVAASASFLAGAGGNTQPIAFPGVAGTISVGEFGTDTQAIGNFDVLVGDAAGNRFEVYGVFKSNACPALAKAWVPFF